MNRAVSLLLIAAMLTISGLFFTSCALGRGTEPIETPYGVWYSEEPDMTLYIDPAQDEIDSHYSGVLYWDGEMVEVFVQIDLIKGDLKGNFMEVFNVDAITENGMLDDYPYCIFNGSMRIRRDGRMEYTLKDYWAERTGYSVIVLEMIDTYGVAQSTSS